MKKVFGNKKLIIGLVVLAVIAIGFGIYQLIPKHNVFIKAPGMHYKRQQVTAVKLQDGNVLVFGSFSGKPNKTAEIYLADKNKYEVLPNEMNRARIEATATLMQDGRVFIVGGEEDTKNPIPPTSEIYDPKTMKFILVKGIKYNRNYHAASLLQDGRVLITGGWRNKPSYLHGRYICEHAIDVDEAEIYNPKTNKFTVVKMHNRIFCHQQITLIDGMVLVTSGANTNLDDSNKPRKVVNAELFDPKTNKFILLEPMHYKRRYGTATLLENGSVLIAGGEEFAPISHVEIFEPNTNKFMVINDMNIKRSEHSSVLLDNGNVLIIGGTNGYAQTIEILDDAEIFDVKQNKFIELEAKMHKKRKNHTSILLNNGNVLIPDYGFSEIYLK